LSHPHGFVIRIAGEAPVRLKTVGEGVTVTQEDCAKAPSIALSVGAFSQLYAGYKSPEELAAASRLQASSSEALEIATALFPRYELYLALPDTF
jgi:predicted acetyltransferase